jgi:glyoxylase-like metal-dependent hydrolase (beta-lactamase superfamily II)
VSTSTHASVSPDSGTHWTEEGAWPAADGVLRIPLPLPNDGLRAVNVYVLEGPDGLSVVDGGWALDASRDVLERSLRAAGHAIGDIRRFLVTHVHRDHYTQAITLRRETGAEVWLGAGERPGLDVMHGDRERNVHAAHLREAGAPDLARAWDEFFAGHRIDLGEWEYPDGWLEDEQELDVAGRRLVAVATPGHTRGHVVYDDPAARVLFAGDHVLPTITPSIAFEPDPPELGLRAFLGSLERVRARPDAMLLPAHGPVAPSVHARADELLAHHDDRLDRCLAAVAATGSTAYDVASALPWTRHEKSLAELDSYNAGLAVLETRLHLDLLVHRGRLTRTRLDGVGVYRSD